MAPKPPTACRVPLCGGYAAERGYCPAHAKQVPKKPDDNARHKRFRAQLREKNDNPFYDTSAWRNRTSPLMLMHNPICQLVLPNGKQCTNRAKAVHHIVGLRTDTTGAHDPRNLVSLCEHHHITGDGDDPNNPRQYTPTKWKLLPNMPTEVLTNTRFQRRSRKVKSASSLTAHPELANVRYPRSPCRRYRTPNR